MCNTRGNYCDESFERPRPFSLCTRFTVHDRFSFNVRGPCTFLITSSADGALAEQRCQNSILTNAILQGTPPLPTGQLPFASFPSPASTSLNKPQTLASMEDRDEGECGGAKEKERNTPSSNLPQQRTESESQQRRENSPAAAHTMLMRKCAAASYSYGVQHMLGHKPSMISARG